MGRRNTILVIKPRETGDKKAVLPKKTRTFNSTRENTTRGKIDVDRGREPLEVPWKGFGTRRVVEGDLDDQKKTTLHYEEKGGRKRWKLRDGYGPERKDT